MMISGFFTSEPLRSQTTVADLRAALACFADDAPVFVLYDSQAGVSTCIEVVDLTGKEQWADPHAVCLDISRGQ